MALHATRPAATTGSSDALVCFGASGDLAKKMIFPALYAMTKRGALTIPVNGVARSNWSLNEFRRHVKESVEASGRQKEVAARWTTYCRPFHMWPVDSNL